MLNFASYMIFLDNQKMPTNDSFELLMPIKKIKKIPVFQQNFPLRNIEQYR